MHKQKSIRIKKQEILSHINDLKVNFNALTLINRTLAEEKKQGVQCNFTEKDIKEKKADILDIIEKEDVSSGTVRKTIDSLESDFPIAVNSIEVKGIIGILTDPVQKDSTGYLQVTGKSGTGEVRFLDGAIMYVLFNGVEGERGFFELLNATEGKAELYITDSSDYKKNIDYETSELILRGLCLSKPSISQPGI